MKKDERKNLLPIGSVVLLKNATIRIMIIGFSPSITSSSEKYKDKNEWDYCGCMYPAGLLAPDQILVFDHSQIETIFFIGYQDDEQINFKKEFISYLNKGDENKQKETSKKKVRKKGEMKAKTSNNKVKDKKNTQSIQKASVKKVKKSINKEESAPIKKEPLVY